MEFISKKNLDLINKKISEYPYEGIIFFVSDENYSIFLNPLLASLNLYAEKWLYIYVQLGSFTFNYIHKKNLIEIKIDYPENTIKNKKKAYAANVRAPIIYELARGINANKLIYTDIDNILVNNVNKLFNQKKLYIRKVNLNLIDQILGSEIRVMKHKSGVIILKTDDKKYLRDDDFIIQFTKLYSDYCLLNFYIWFTDQIYLSKTIEELINSYKYISFNKKFCDWDFSPYSYFWAAKGYIKDTILWKLISKKTIFIFMLKRKLNSKYKNLILSILLFSDKTTNFLIYPIMFIRYKLINFLFRFIKFYLKKLFSKIIKD